VSAATLTVFVAAMVVGFGSGVMSGMLGIGGAVVSTPAVRVLGATPLEAVGTTVPAILPGAVIGVWRYHKADLVDWRIGVWCGASGSVAAVVGAVVADGVGEPGLLMVATAVLMGISGWSVARSGRRMAPAGQSSDTPPSDTPPSDTAPADAPPVDAPPADAPPAGASDVDMGPSDAPWPALVALGVAGGFVAGILGVGGGIILLPAFTSLLGMPVRKAVPASLVAVAIFSVPALVTHAVNGNIDWLLAVPLMVGVVPGARLGSRLTVASSERTVRLLFGTVIGALAVVYGVTEVLGLRG
jgi:uncharacterized protein